MAHHFPLFSLPVKSVVKKGLAVRMLFNVCKLRKPSVEELSPVEILGEKECDCLTLIYPLV